MLMFLFTSSAFSQKTIEPDTLKTYNLGEVYVTGEKNIIEKVSTVENISRSEIEGLDAFTLDESFSLTSGMYLRRDIRSEPLINLRGFDQRQIMIYRDGVPVSHQFNGIIDISNFSTSSTGKIAVAKSMPSLIYGSNTMGGAINFISRRPQDDLSFRADLKFREAGYGIQAGAGGTAENFYWIVNGSYQKSNTYRLPSDIPANLHEDGGFRDNSSFENRNIFVKAGAMLNNTDEVAVSINYIDNSETLPANIYSDFARYWRFPEWKSMIYNLMGRFSVSDPLTIKTNVYFMDIQNTLSSYDDSTYSTQTRRYAFNSTQTDRTLGANFSAAYDWGTIEPTVFSLNYKRDSHEEAGTPDFEASTVSVSIEQEVAATDKLGFAGGASVDFLSGDYGNFSEADNPDSPVNAQFGAFYEVNNDLRLYAHAARKSRLPTMKELFAETALGYLPNPELNAEKTWNFEIGAAAEFLGIYADLAFFNSNITDLIQIVGNDQGDLQFQNIDESVYRGAEITLRKEIAGINIMANYTFLDAVYTYMGTEFDDKLQPQHNFNAAVSRKYDFGFRWIFEANYLSESNMLDTRDEQARYVELDARTLINAKLSQQITDNFDIYVRINNILDDYYESVPGYPQPGRTIWAGVKFNR